MCQRGEVTLGFLSVRLRRIGRAGGRASGKPLPSLSPSTVHSLYGSLKSDRKYKKSYTMTSSVCPAFKFHNDFELFHWNSYVLKIWDNF